MWRNPYFRRSVGLALVLAALQASQYVGVCYRNVWAPFFDLYSRIVARSVAALTGASLAPVRREPLVSDFLLNGKVPVSWNNMHLEIMVSVAAFVVVFPGTLRAKFFYSFFAAFCFWLYNVGWYTWCVRFPEAAKHFVYSTMTSMPDWAFTLTGVWQGLPAILALALVGGRLLMIRKSE